ncbi:MAG: D-TA family PLP-dependent enzyme [Chryseolinea sp.]
MSYENDWYAIDNIDKVDTPALVLYPERIKENIQLLVNSIDDLHRLRPHVKTHKSLEVIRLMMDAGITKFKCATIAEAELLGMAGAIDVLLAYQPVGPKASRFAKLIKQFPSTAYSCLVDNVNTAGSLSSVAAERGIAIAVYIDVNVGMNRTGIAPTGALELIEACLTLPGIILKGLHVYDGHLRDTDLQLRKEKCDKAFEAVLELQAVVNKKFNRDLTIIAGGMPTYPIHSQRKDVECSPGTFVYWDKGYSDLLTEQQYLFAALVITRVVSKPSESIICLDLGHKAIASEGHLLNRVHFLNRSNLTPIGHSEEHMVMQVEGVNDYCVGDVLYGVPFHICPTVALHQTPAIVKNKQVAEYWNTISRSRMITV